jgi:hypothetical protein
MRLLSQGRRLTLRSSSASRKPAQDGHRPSHERLERHHEKTKGTKDTKGVGSQKRGTAITRQGRAKKRITAQLGLDPKTVRRYLRAAETAGVRVTPTISDDEVRQVLLALHPAGGRPRGDGWAHWVEQRAAIAR